MYDLRKRDHFTWWTNFCFLITHNFKTVIASLETRYGDSSITALNARKISRSAHFRYEHGYCEYHMQSKISRFMPHFGAPPFQVRKYLHFL